ncbi:hypothetical protein ACI2K4_26315 [Micromonospora sp. NPDC050397]|uniref:hypothetical protein n=1 Tax=Micromonospora sp. NPDC050397 TaxID=3364279 RepID=UPI00384CFC67
MSDDASPYFVRPHRFDQPDHDDRGYPQLDREHRVVLDPGERSLWHGRVNAAGYLLGPSLGNGTLHWSLPRPVELTVTDRRLAFVCDDWDFEEVTVGGPPPGRPRHRRRDRAAGRISTGQIRWQWPGRLHLMPAEPATEHRPQRPERLLLVCDSLRTIRQPALALGAGGDLGRPGAARELIQLVRRAVAQFRLAHPGTPEMSPQERDILTSRASSGQLSEGLSDPRRGISLPGAMVVEFTHRDDYHRRSTRSSFSARRAPQAGSAGLRRSRQPGSAS